MQRRVVQAHTVRLASNVGAGGVGHGPVTLKVGGGVHDGVERRQSTVHEASAPGGGASTPLMVMRHLSPTSRQGAGAGATRPAESLTTSLKGRVAPPGIVVQHGASRPSAAGAASGAASGLTSPQALTPRSSSRQLMMFGSQGQAQPSPPQRRTVTTGGREPSPRGGLAARAASAVAVGPGGIPGHTAPQRYLQGGAPSYDAGRPQPEQLAGVEDDAKVLATVLAAVERQLAGPADECAQSEVSTATGYADTHHGGLGPSSCTSPQLGSTPRVSSALPAGRLAGAGKDLGGLRAELERLRAQATARKDLKAASISKRQAAAPPSAASSTAASAAAGAVGAAEAAAGAPASSASSVVPSDAPLAAAEAALAAAEAALAREEGAAAASAAASSAGPSAEDVQLQLERLAGAFRSEQRLREHLTGMVRQLDSRLNEGLVSIGEVAQARMATDSATDTMLSALRKCVDEINEQCAWPAGQGFEAGAGPSLAQLVLQHDASIKEAAATQQALLERQARQLEQLERQGERQGELAKEASVVASGLAAWQAEHRQLAAAVEALGARAAEAGGAGAAAEQRLEQLKADNERVQERLLLLEARAPAPAAGGERLASAVQAMESQMESLRAEKSQVADALRAMGEEQQHLKSMQQQVLAAVAAQAATSSGGEAAPGAEVAAAAAAAAAAAVERMEEQLRQLRDENGQLSEELRGLKSQHEALQAAHQGHEETLRSTAERLEERQAASAASPQKDEVGKLREELSGLTSVVTALFEKVNALAADSKEQLSHEVSSVAGMVRNLADGMDRMGLQWSRLDRVSRDPRSPDAVSFSGDVSQCSVPPMSARSRLQHSTVSFSQTGAFVDPWARRGFGDTTSEPSMRDLARSPQGDALSDAAKELPASLRAPSPRNWLTEPLSVTLARADGTGSYPSSLGQKPSEQPLMQSTPALGSIDLLTRGRAGDRP